jgi:ankyrin repeat protein
MENLRAQIRKWRRATSTYRYSRNDESSAQLFDAIYDNNFKLAKILIDSRKVDVNIKDECGDTPLIAVCKQTTLQTEGDAIRFINYLWQRGSKFNTCNDLGKTAMNYAESNGLTKIRQHLQYVHWKTMFDSLCNVGLF